MKTPRIVDSQKAAYLPDHNFILDLSTCVNWANICADLPTEVSHLFTYYVCRFLFLVRQHDSDWGFSFISHSGMWILEHFWFNESGNGWLHTVIRIAQSGEDLFKAFTFYLGESWNAWLSVMMFSSDHKGSASGIETTSESSTT